MKLTRLAIAAWCFIAFAGSAQAQQAMTYEALREQDLRLASLAEQMQGANVDLCVETMPLTGMILHSADQYGSPPEGWFANGQVEVLGIVPGSPAYKAGIMAGDGLSAVQGTPVGELPMEGEQPLRDDVFWTIAGQQGELQLAIVRDGEEREIVFDAPLGCSSLVEVLANQGDEARSDGRVIQISYGVASRLSDENLAVVFAHELGHSVLLHRRRLEAAGVSKGFFGEFGRNRRIGREVEIEADRMAVTLLYNAGYDPESAPAFWRSDASSFAGGGIFRSRLYPSRNRRAEITQEEVDILDQEATEPPFLPGHLLSQRDVPFED